MCFLSKKLISVLMLLFVFLGISFLYAQHSKVQLEMVGRGLIIGTPSNLDLGTVSAGSTIQANFSDYFWVEDLRGTNTGHYTTIQCDGLYGPSGAMITGVELSGAVVDLVAGLANNTLIYSNLTSWTDITEPKLYLYRNNDISNGGKINRYGNKPSIKIIVPSGTPVGTYKGKIIYTLYDMPFSY